MIMTLFLENILICSIFTQVLFHSTVALQAGRHYLRDVATVLLVLVSVFSVSSNNLRCTRWWWDPTSVWSIGCCQNPCAFKNFTGLLQLMAQ